MQVTLSLSDRLFKYSKDLLLLLMVCGIIYGLDTKYLDPNNEDVLSPSLLPYVYIFLVSYISSEISASIYIPKILGMILGGLIFGNTVEVKFHPQMSSILRNIALSTILLEGGLGLDPAVLRKTSWTCLSLCLVPLITDTLITGILGHLLLGLPIIWSFMLGFTLSAACAAIIVPHMMDLIKQSLGTNRGIPSIILAAASMDDVIAIAGFGVLLGYAFDDSPDSGNLSWNLCKGPTEIVSGIALGYFFGTLIGIFPFRAIWPSCEPRGQLKTKLSRLSLLLLASLASIFLTEKINLAGIGPLSVLAGAFFAGNKFRSVPGVVDEIGESIHIIWSLMQLFLFGIMGAELKITSYQLDFLPRALGVVLIGIICRFICTFLSLSGSNLNAKEKSFVSIAWLAKAAVQATLAPIALDLAIKKGLGLEMLYGHAILTVSVLAVLISTPIATLGLMFLPKKLLTDEPPPYSGPPPPHIIVSDDSIDRRLDTLHEVEFPSPESTYTNRPAGEYSLSTLSLERQVRA